MYRFAKLPMRANDPTRRYRIVREPDRQTAGEIEIGGDAPDGDTAVLTVTCGPSLSDADRAEVLGAARRFLAELAAGWGVQVAEEPGGAGWEGKADGGARARVTYRVVCENP